ncbi:MAG: hypothetical protein GX413_13830 [Acetobacter sp.]|nr:hypothetical protein [Acetobacter sp.]
MAQSEIQNAFFSATDNATQKVQIGRGTREAIRQFLTNLHEQTTVGEIIAALEEEWKS